MFAVVSASIIEKKGNARSGRAGDFTAKKYAHNHYYFRAFVYGARSARVVQTLGYNKGSHRFNLLVARARRGFDANSMRLSYGQTNTRRINLGRGYEPDQNFDLVRIFDVFIGVFG